MPSSCFYCERRATRLQRAVPAWIPERLGLEREPLERVRAEDVAPVGDGGRAEIPQFLPSAKRSTAGPAPDVETTSETIALAEYGARVLCAECDARFTRLEGVERSVLEPLVSGSAQNLDREQQRAVSAWGARTAYAVLAVEGKASGVPREHRRRLREDRAPHPNVFVSVGRASPSGLRVVAARITLAREETPNSRSAPTAYNVLAVFGELVLKVFGVESAAGEYRFRAAGGTLVQVWPPDDDDVHWPPLWPLRGVGIEEAFLFDPVPRR